MSRHQKKIIERYYEHKDTIQANRLAELVSELYLADSGKSTKLWDRAAAALAGAGVDPQRINRIVSQRDIQALAAIAGELAVGKAKSTNSTSTTTRGQRGAK